MANVVKNKGFEVISNTRPEFQQTFFCDDSAAVSPGDIVTLDSSTSDGSDALGLPKCKRWADNDVPLGVVQSVDPFKGISAANLSFTRTHKPASLDMYIHVNTDPNAVMLAQDDGNTLSSGDISSNADITAGTANSDGLSRMKIAGSSVATTNTLPLNVLRAYQTDQYTPFAANGLYVVTWNIHQYKGDTGATGSTANT